MCNIKYVNIDKIRTYKLTKKEDYILIEKEFLYGIDENKSLAQQENLCCSPIWKVIGKLYNLNIKTCEFLIRTNNLKKHKNFEEPKISICNNLDKYYINKYMFLYCCNFSNIKNVSTKKVCKKCQLKDF